MTPFSETHSTSGSAIVITDLALSRSGSTLFSELSLTFDRGDKALLTAPSGYGKSTLLRSLLGFVPATAGSITIFGRKLTPQSAWQLRCRMAYVDQEPDLGEGTVEAALRRPFGYKNNQHLHLDPDQIAALMEQLHLPDSLLNKPTSSLSGGERQRVAVISALLLERDILLLDEPTSALDQDNGSAIAKLLKGKTETTVVAISHDAVLVETFDRVINLKQHSRRSV
ncbi:MAG TPA: ATP-binding cassette domain-containing protein [Pelovirga sp.]|nr:ATP-binding cassette domain-containing protein [Pelovirga sp.]